jgi:hypothetical protein
VRGRTLLAAIIDEVAFLRDETSASPDIETYRALLPALATTGGMLIGISTPYRRTGLLYQKHRDHFGVDDPDVLVVSGDAQRFNPTLDKGVIDRARESDPEAARAEWDAQFRADIASFLDDPLIDAAVDHDRPLVLPPRGQRYFAFIDPSGGRHDAFTLCIGHRIGYGRDAAFIADLVRATQPPFDPQAVVREYCEVIKAYKITSVHGDRYSAEWVVSSFKERGIRYQTSEKSKSDIYLESMPLFTRNAIRIPDLPPLLRELRLLERQTHRGGRDTVDHPRRGSDDLANALCGCAVLAVKGGYDATGAWISGPDLDTEEAESEFYKCGGVEILSDGPFVRRYRW